MGMKPYWKTGVVLALTLAVGYTVCAVLYAAWPSLGIDFLNAMFHGLDFHKIDTGEPFTLRMFVYPFVVFVVWGFAVGTLFAWISNLLYSEQ
ncbi:MULTISPECIES: DUF5676 family membrane protein [Burkholderiaceae]|nr:MULTISPECIES: DUF5676 family membrane protein [Burkholderiaceae]ASW03723.1 hypothetical protein CJU94_36620 [Paraburkholderia aromaticivorans]MBR8008580.1 hypothetical protein [Burkholderia vietnamiensis]MBR8054674.1 hypothetical protein [Burkholderia vietnamiensis]MCB4349714.1 DUF5676 family membrane protein [Burkholderia vietnamiensis]HDR9174248.1 hypothetical protein [Burkholderia vietnamiensis]